MADEAQKQPEKRSGLYTIVRGLFAGLFHTFLLPVKFHDLDRLRGLEAPYIVIGNHSSGFDPLVVAVADKKNQLCFMGKKELASSRIMKWAFKQLRAIPVDRHNMDMEAMRASMRALKSGHPMCIFPEGTRYHEGIMEQLESGTALLALRANVPLIPLYINHPARPFRRTDCYVGEPIEIADIRANGVGNESCQALLNRITGTYAMMVAADRNARGLLPEGKPTKK